MTAIVDPSVVSLDGFGNGDAHAASAGLSPHRHLGAPTAPELADPTLGGGRRRSSFRLPGAVRRLAGPLVLFGLWELVTTTGMVNSDDLAAPRQVWDQAWRLFHNGQLIHGLGVSLGRAGWGLGIGVVLGVTLAVLASSFRLADDIVDSSMNMLRAIPIIALLPLIIIWIGFGESARVFIVAIGATFPIYTNTHGAIRGVDGKLVEAAKVFGVDRRGLIRKVIVPGALPGFLIGLRWAIGVSWLLLVFAEQVNATSGLGYLLNQAQSISQGDVIVLLLIVYGTIGLLGDGLVRVLEKRLLAWRLGFVAS